MKAEKAGGPSAIDSLSIGSSPVEQNIAVKIRNLDCLCQNNGLDVTKLELRKWSMGIKVS